jgi:Tfp pilus assembly major pilin PilA
VIKAGGVEIHQLRIPSHDASNDAGADPKTVATLRAFARVSQHLYWIEEGDFLVFAKVPQLLMDRVASKPDTSLTAWLHDSQSYDAAHTLLGYTGTTHGLQRTVYYDYLGLLEVVGDVLGKPVDLTPMPSAGQLKLPAEGIVGMALLADEQRLSLRVTYEQTPAEMAFGGSSTMTTVAVIAILAAIAIPAYQDYVIRSQVSEGASLADGAKTAVAEYYANKGQMPHDNAQAGMATPASITGNYASSVTIEDGKIVVAYDGAQANAALHGQTLVFAANPEQGTIRWTCDTMAGTTVPVKYRPTVCRP